MKGNEVHGTPDNWQILAAKRSKKGQGFLSKDPQFFA
jgi:hypothetical protein